MKISIGELSRRTDVKVATIRYYEFDRPHVRAIAQRRETAPLFRPRRLKAHFHSPRTRARLRS